MSLVTHGGTLSSSDFSEFKLNEVILNKTDMNKGYLQFLIKKVGKVNHLREIKSGVTYGKQIMNKHFVKSFYDALIF